MRRAAAFAVAAALSACGPAGGGGDEARPVGLAPTYPPAVPAAPAGQAAATTIPGAAPGPATPPDAGGTEPPATTATASPGPGPGSGPAPDGEPALTATVVDREGDPTPFLGGAPAWADIVQGRLFRRADGFELRVALGGGRAPASSGSADRTMNLASFYDVDGDGDIDYQVWANLADGGWDGSYFDDVGGRADFGRRSGVTVEVDGAEVVVRFPLAHLAEADAFRWSLASEYGSYDTIGTVLAARDDAPDGDAPAAFPG